MQSESEHKAEEVTGMHPFAFRFTFQLNHKVEGIESLYCFPHLQSGRISVHPIFSLQHQQNIFCASCCFAQQMAELSSFS